MSFDDLTEADITQFALSLSEDDYDYHRPEIRLALDRVRGL